MIVGPLGANPAFLALPPFAGAAWYTQMAGVTLAMTAMQVFAKAQMNTASLKDEFEKLYEINVRNIPETQWPDGNEEGEIQKLLSVYKKKSKKFIDLHVKSKEQVREIRNVVSVFVAQILGPFGANPALLALPYMGGTAWIKQVRAARKWAVAYVTAALPVGVALNDRNSRRRCGIPIHRRA